MIIFTSVFYNSLSGLLLCSLCRRKAFESITFFIEFIYTINYEYLLNGANRVFRVKWFSNALL